LGIEIFSDLDYAGDVALLAEMLEVLLLALEVLKDEAHFLGLKVDWHKIRIQSTTDPVTLPATVSVSGNSVDIVQSFCLLRLGNSHLWQFRTRSLMQDRSGKILF